MFTQVPIAALTGAGDGVPPLGGGGHGGEIKVGKHAAEVEAGLIQGGGLCCTTGVEYVPAALDLG